jgi:3-oxoadipate enol-lactonase
VTGLVFLHGAASTPDVWARQRRHFPGARYLAFPPAADDPAEVLNRYADLVIAETHAMPAILIGHSLGGAVALTAALRRPDVVTGVVLVGSAARLPVSPAILDGLRTDPAGMLRRIADWSLARDADPRLRTRCHRIMEADDPASVLRQFQACAAYDVRPEHDRWPRRLAAIVGAEDRMTPPALIRELAAVRLDVPVIEIPGAGHLVMLEQPTAFNRALADVLTSWQREDLDNPR